MKETGVKRSDCRALSSGMPGISGGTPRLNFPRPLRLFVFILISLSSCNISKYLPANERLFAGSKIQMRGDSGVSAAEQKTLQGQLEDLARPKPNGRILGFPFKVWAYYFIGEPRNEHGFRAWMRRRFGEPPVLASAKAVSSNQRVFVSALESQGYFRSEVSGQLAEKGYEATAVYDVLVRPQYRIDSVAFLPDSSEAGRAMVRLDERSLLKKGDPYRFDRIRAEQDRISQRLRTQGFYYFQPDYVAVLADSGIGQHRIRLFLALKPEMPAAARVPYSIRNVFIYPTYTLTGAANDTNRTLAYQTPDAFYVVDSAHRYKPQLFKDVVGLRPGRRYNSRAQDLTLSRFINLGAFKFVRNRFEPDFQGDSAVLDVHYYLTPFPKKSARLEIGAVSRSNNFTGSQLTLSWRNRNSLRRAELFTINGNAGIEFQVGGGPQGVTNYRYGLEGNLAIPRLVSPFPIRYDRRQLLPKTTITLGYDLLVRENLYHLNSFRAAYGYAWQRNARTELVFQPFTINYVRTSRFGDRFFELLADPNTPNEYLTFIQDDQLILGNQFSFSFNSSPRTSSRYTYRVGFNAETAGNVASLFLKRVGVTGRRELFNVPYAQYARVDLDNRHFFKLTPGLTWASRLLAGVGVPYGNSDKLPFVRQFFAGGSTSIRAFRPRAVGPGTYHRVGEGRPLLLQDGGGDIRLEGSTELRAQLNRYLQGALFLDVGNVWMYQDTLTFGPGARFTPAFYKQLAVGTGAGIRFDFSYFVLRFDLAFPLRKPWLPEGQRWVADQLAPGNRAWRRENLILNVAVGYPF